MKRLLAWWPITLFLIGITNAQQPDTLVVFAASSLTDAFLEIKAGFETQHPDINVVFNFAGSSTLAAQLAQGAPADVFASANLAQINLAREAQRITSTPQIFATNQLIMIVPADNPANIHTLADLAQPGVKLVVAAPGVPIRDYTDQMIQQWTVQPGTKDEFVSAVKANIVSEESNVRQVAFKVAFGGADVGIAYTTDITPDLLSDVRSIAIPDEFNVIASYPIAVVHDTQHPENAVAFIHYVLSRSGQATLKNWGFSPAVSPVESLISRLLHAFSSAP